MKRPIFFLESTVSGRKDEGEFTNLRSFVVMVVYFHTRELNLYTLGLQKHHPGRKTIFQIVKSTGIPEPGNFSCVCLHTAWRLVWQPAFRSVCSLISQLPLAWSTKLHLRTTLFFFFQAFCANWKVGFASKSPLLPSARDCDSVTFSLVLLACVRLMARCSHHGLLWGSHDSRDWGVYLQ